MSTSEGSGSTGGPLPVNGYLPERPPKPFSQPIAFVFSLNYIVGTGLLIMPYAFIHAGLAFGVAYLFFITVLSMITSCWLLEVGARAEGIRATATGESFSLLTERPHFSLSDSRKLEVNQLCEIFLGKWCRNIYLVLVCLYMYATLWSYSSVFAHSMTSFVPLPTIDADDSCIQKTTRQSEWNADCIHANWIFLGVFALIATPLTCLDLSKQRLVQVVLWCFRLIAVLTMLVSMLMALLERGMPDGLVWGADSGGLASAMTAASFAQVLHYSVPGLAMPIREKRKMPMLLRAVLAFSFLLYSLVGCLAAVTFGSKTQQMVTINWGHLPEKLGDSTLVLIAKWVVVFFPVVETVSSFPLWGVTLANTFLAALPPAMTRDGRAPSWKVASRLLAALPPILGALLIRELNTIITYAGLLGFLVAFVTPALLQLSSVRLCQAQWGADGHLTDYSSRLSCHPVLMPCVLGLVLLSFLATLVFVVLELPSS